MGKILLIVSLVFTLATAALGFLNKGKLAEAANNLQTTSDDLTKTKGTLTKAQNDLKAATDTLATTTAEKDQLTGQVTSLQGELETSKKQVVEQTGKVTEIQGQLDSVTAERDKLKQDIAALPVTPGGGPDQDVLKNLQTELEEKNTLISKLQSDLESAQAKWKVLDDQNRARQARQIAKGLEGQVLAVNPAWNFVVLNLGDKNGVASNTELLVKRGNQLVGKVRITSVEPSTSIADIVAKSVPAGTTIAPGDNVIFQGSDD